MPHPLEKEYGLTASELLDAIERRFRAKVTLEGAVAEVHLGKQIRALREDGTILKYEEHDRDGYPDYSIWLPDYPARRIRIECKNVRDSDEAYRKNGAIVAYKVETQKTRASKGDPKSRYYSHDQFEILAVCLGKKTHNWRDFMYIESRFLTRHPRCRGKLNVMHKVPLPSASLVKPWYNDLGKLLSAIERG